MAKKYRVLSQPEHTVELWGNLVGKVGRLASTREYDDIGITLYFIRLGPKGAIGRDFPFEAHEIEEV